MDARLSPAARLAARDDGARLHAVDRALLVLGLDGDEPAEALAALPLAERDRRLFARRAATFGDGIDCLADCPACGGTQEFRLSAAAVAAGLGAAADDPSSPPTTVASGGVAVEIRALTSLDLAAAARTGDAGAAAALLVERAIVRIDGRDPADAGPLPPAVRTAVEARIEAREADADVALALSCADCGASWAASFDIAACFWAEIEADARRLIGEVAALAERFGWSEEAILALPPSRRRAYLEAGRPS